MPTAAEKKELAERQATEAAMYSSMEEDAGIGLEQADAECYAVPFIKILQKLSPEVDKTESAFVEGAEPNMFFNTASNELYDTTKGIVLIPCHFQRRFLKWKPRNSGGGYLGSFTPEEYAQIENLKPDDHGRMVDPNGDYYADTREHYCLLVNGDVYEPVLISLGSTQIKKSRNWVSAMSKLKVTLPNGKVVTPPTFAKSYRATTVLEKNDQGSWSGWKITPHEMVTNPDLYAAAKAFRDQIISGAAKAAEPDPTGTGAPADDVEF